MFVIQIYVQMNIIALRMAVAGTTEEAAACLQLQIKSKATQLSITTGSIRWRLHLCLDTTMVSKELCLLTTSKTPTRVHQGELQPPIQISAGTVGLVSIGGAAS